MPNRLWTLETRKTYRAVLSEPALIMPATGPGALTTSPALAGHAAQSQPQHERQADAQIADGKKRAYERSDSRETLGVVGEQQSKKKKKKK